MRSLPWKTFCLLFAVGAMRAIPAPNAMPTLALIDVAVIPMDRPGILPHRTVVIREGRIVSIAPMASADIPAGAERVAGDGRILFPGLIDAHVHLRDRERAGYLEDGVLTVRNMWGYPELLHDTTTMTPWVHSLSPGIDGSPASWPLTQLLDDPREAERTVARLQAEGWTTLKVYQRLTLAAFDSVVVSAGRHRLRFAGHVPTAVPVQHALASGMRSIEHLTGYDRVVDSKHQTGTWAWRDVDITTFAGLVRATVQAGTWNCPTMAIYAVLAAQHPADERARIEANRRAFVLALYRGGARIVAGTDAGIDVLPSAGALHTELRQLRAAGLPIDAVLASATSEAGRLLDQPGLGTITVGAPAQLLLLDADPRADLDALRHPAGIVLRGRWMPRLRDGHLVPSSP